MQSSRRPLLDAILPGERSLKRLSTRLLLKTPLLLQILHGRKTETVLKFSRKMKHKNLKLQLSWSKASLIPLGPRRQLIQNLLLQVLGKTSTLWFTRPHSTQGWLPWPLRLREPLNLKTLQLLLLPSPEGERQIKNVEKRKRPQISARALRRNWILSLRGFPLRLFNVLSLYSSLLTIRESLFLQAFFFSE